LGELSVRPPILSNSTTKRLWAKRNIIARIAGSVLVPYMLKTKLQAVLKRLRRLVMPMMILMIFIESIYLQNKTQLCVTARLLIGDFGIGFMRKVMIYSFRGISAGVIGVSSGIIGVSVGNIGVDGVDRDLASSTYLAFSCLALAD
jgi:hypothetical protein